MNVPWRISKCACGRPKELHQPKCKTCKEGHRNRYIAYRGMRKEDLIPTPPHIEARIQVYIKRAELRLPLFIGYERFSSNLVEECA